MILTEHSYSPWLVLLSYVVASIASYTALELVRRVTKSYGRVAKNMWLGAGAVGMGIGIWSMHFIGMLAYDPHMPVTYDIPITALSWVVAVLVSAFALFIGSRGSVNLKRLFISGVVMGAGICAMHYTGMAAVRVPATLHYDPTLFALSVVIAMTASSVALWLFFMFSSHEQGAPFRYKATAALVMGLAICGMHYTGMAAVYYVADHAIVQVASNSNDNLWLATSVGFATLFMLGVTLLIAFFDRKLSMQQEIGKYLETIVEERTAELYLEKERAVVTLDSIADAVITTDADSHVEYLNPVAEQLTGWNMEDVKSKPLNSVFNVINESTRQLGGNIAATVLREGQPMSVSGQSVLVARDGREHAIDESAAPIRDRDEKVIGAVLVFRDVSAKRELARQLSHQASHDTLTGLTNRQEFENRLRKALETAFSDGHEHVLLFMDLDNFKTVNDTCGHAAGDDLLRQVSRGFRGVVRETDVVARLGGDEFGVLLQKCPPAVGENVAEKLRKFVEDYRFVWKDRTFNVGVSIGLTLIDAGHGGLTQVLNAADGACYVAKQNGRNNVHVSDKNDEQQTRQSSELGWPERIRQALAEDRFVFYYQSIEPLESSQPSENGHFEVLTRFRDENGKLLPPGAFIPAAERYGMMPAIDRWIVTNVLDALAHDRAPHSTIHTCAINLSGQSIAEDEFLAFVEDQFDKTGVDPKLICFEILEAAAIANLQKVTTFIAALRARGCRFSLDDFGTGLASFAYLRNLQVDYLKIDGAFVKGMVDNELDAAVVFAICHIGQVLGLKTIAEFVENDRIVRKLKEVGVDFVQGYGIEIPRPLSENSNLVAMENIAKALASR